MNRYINLPGNEHLKEAGEPGHEEYKSNTPLDFAPDPYDTYADLLAYEKSRNRKLTNELRKLRGLLSDREESARMLAELSSGVLERHSAKNLTEVKYVPRSTPRLSWYCLAPLADVHAGKYVWGKEGWGRDYDTKEAASRLEQHGLEVANYIRSEGGKCEIAFLPDVGDLFHALDGQTQSGTILHQDTRAKKVYAQTFEARLAAIEHVRKVVPYIEVYEAEGNHDHQWHFNFYHALAQYYRDVQDVTVVRSESTKAYFSIGEVIHFFDHGKGVSRLSTPTAQKKIRLTVEQRVPQEDLGRASRIHYWCGHLHYREFTEDGKYHAERLPSLCEPDDFEEMLRVASTPGAVVYRLSEDGHVVGNRQIYI